MGASISQVEFADNPYMKAPVWRASVKAAQTRAGSAATKHANARGIGDEARTPSMALMSPTLNAGVALGLPAISQRVPAVSAAVDDQGQRFKSLARCRASGADCRY